MATKKAKAASGGDGAAAYAVYREALGGQDQQGPMVEEFAMLPAHLQAAWNAVAGVAGAAGEGEDAGGSS